MLIARSRAHNIQIIRLDKKLQKTKNGNNVSSATWVQRCKTVLPRRLVTIEMFARGKSIFLQTGPDGFNWPEDFFQRKNAIDDDGVRQIKATMGLSKTNFILAINTFQSKHLLKFSINVVNLINY